MRVKVWGARGTLPAPGPDTARYGGNTSCVTVEGNDGTMLVLDAGSGVRVVTSALPPTLKRIDLLLTHLHLDHIIGLGFFGALRWPSIEAHIWGPAGTALDLETRIMRYLSPPYFPMHLNELTAQITLHEIADSRFQIGEFDILSAPVSHPGPTLGFRITGASGKTMAYIPDHEPALGVEDFPSTPEWTSGYNVAEGVDLLLHDAQYTDEEYPDRIGWGHSSTEHVMAFARMTEVAHVATFHHDPNRTDDQIDGMVADAQNRAGGAFTVSAATEGEVYDLS